ncbi:MAG: DUF4870 domain-containing protein [Dehalococcoidia bacterium]|nr:DUF4870 domain-containing protein [Dehalococcoidia bacterium]
MSEEKKSGTGIEPNIAGLLCYVLGWVTGLVFFLIEKDDEFVRFHAMQSIIVFGALHVAMIIMWVFYWIPYVGILFMVVASLISIAAFVLWIILMVKAYQGERYKLPVAGELAEKYSAKR